MAPLIQVARRAAQVRFNRLPPDCFIKASHGCTWNLLRRDGKLYPFGDGSGGLRRALSGLRSRHIIAQWLATARREPEWAYTVKPRHVLVEELLQPRSGAELMDYRLSTFDGRVRAINVGSADYRRTGCNVFLDPHWKPMPLTSYRESLPDPLPGRPDNLAVMLDIAGRLGTGLDFVRVDLFDTTRGVLLGEMTVYPQGGGADTPTTCPDFNHWLGRQWQLRN